MRTHPIGKALALAALTSLVVVSAAWASSANFVISGKGIELGKAKEDGDKPPVFSAKAEVGKPFTLTAQGRAYGRGDLKGSPIAPDSGAWSFDDKAFEKVAPDKNKKADKSEVVVTLKPTKAGTSRVRFPGKVLGYERTFDVVIEVAAKKKE
jgi:hypothetical protein